MISKLSEHIGADAVVDPLHELELLVSFKAQDETQRETLRATHSYCVCDLVGHARFADMLVSNPVRSLRTMLRMDLIHTVLPLSPEDLEAEARAVDAFNARERERRRSALSRAQIKGAQRAHRASQVSAAEPHQLLVDRPNAAASGPARSEHSYIETDSASERIRGPTTASDALEVTGVVGSHSIAVLVS
jgi:hypothetical protein